MKIFKKVLPVVVGLALILVIGITIVVVQSVNSQMPVLSDKDESYLTLGHLNVTKQQLYESLKKDYGVAEIVRLVDQQLYKDEMTQVKDEDLVPYIEEDIYGEDFKGDKQKKWEEVLESLVLTGIITPSDAKDNAYDNYDSPTWTKVKDYYRLQYAKEQWAKKAYLEKYRKDNDIAADASLFEDEDIEDYFEDNFGKVTSGLYIPFTSTDSLEAMLKNHGVNITDTKTSNTTNQYAGWVKDTYSNETQEYPVLTDYFTPDEIVQIFIDIYNEMWAYTNGGKDIITDEMYEKVVSEKYTLALAKRAVEMAMKKTTTIKGDLQLPLEIAVVEDLESNNPYTSNVSIELSELTADENFSLDVATGLITVGNISTTIKRTITGTLKFGESTLEVTFDLSKTDTSGEKEETKTISIDPIKVVYEYHFNEKLNNDITEYSNFIFEAKDSTTFGQYLSSSNTSYSIPTDGVDFYKAYSVTSKTVGSYYCLYIKFADGILENGVIVDGEPTLENSRDEVIAKMTEDLYAVGSNDKANLERMYYERRKDNKFKIYDRFIEAIYEYNYNTFYSSTLSETDYPEFKKTTKNKKKIVASINGFQITPDDLFKELEAKYGATYVKNFVDQYYIINTDFNQYFNPYEGIEDKDYIKSLLKSDIASFKQNFELDYFTYSYLSYYGFIPNFPSSYGWKDFIHDYFNANDEKELLISKSYGGTIYSDALDAYTASLYDFTQIKAAMDEAYDEAYQVDVMNLIIYVDYDYDGNPDTTIVESNKEDVTEDNWTEEQKVLAEELAKLIMTRYNEVSAVGSISSKLTEVVNVYNNASYVTPEEIKTLSDEFVKYKQAGLQIKFEASANYTHTSSLVEEFKDAMVEIWHYAKENDLVYDTEKAKDDKNYVNPIVEPIKYNVVNDEGRYTFLTSYGYHAVAVERATSTTPLPTEEEINLYDAYTEFTSAKSSLESANTNLSNAAGNETAVASYKEQIKRLEKEYQEKIQALKDAIQALKDTGNYEDMEDYNEKDETFTLDEDINTRCTAWYTNAKTKVEEHIVEKELIKLLQDDIASSKVTFPTGFNREQFDYYLDYLLEHYAEEE